ncbi:MAG: hypothetical protein R3F60_18860 [bacterium]
MAVDAGEVLDACLSRYRATHDPAEEIEALSAAAAAARAGRLVGQEAGVLGGLARILAAQGRIDAARAALERARLIAEQTAQDVALGHFESMLAQLPAD